MAKKAKTTKKVEEEVIDKEEIKEALIEDNVPADVIEKELNADETTASEAIEKFEEAGKIEVNHEEVEKKLEEVTEAINEVTEVANEIKELGNNKAEIEKALEKNPEEAQKVLEKELEKAKKLYNRVKNNSFTSSWNGMNYNY